MEQQSLQPMRYNSVCKWESIDPTINYGYEVEYNL
jgi:hypothetical protein